MNQQSLLQMLLVLLLLLLLLFSRPINAQPGFGGDDVDDEYVDEEPPAASIKAPVPLLLGCSLIAAFYFIGKYQKQAN